MGKILDKIFYNKKMSIFIPMLIAAVIYLLYIIFGNSENKLDTILALPIISAFLFFGAFLVIWVQVKNTFCPEWFLNLFELLVIIVFSISIILNAIQFIAGGFQNLDFGLCMELLTFSAVSWAHSKRKGS